ncbi:hypothetical protein PENTCL1PPCAC_25906, partial [Pristionchus entomophagus]
FRMRIPRRIDRILYTAIFLVGLLTQYAVDSAKCDKNMIRRGGHPITYTSAHKLTCGRDEDIV